MYLYIIVLHLNFQKDLRPHNSPFYEKLIYTNILPSGKVSHILHKNEVCYRLVVSDVKYDVTDMNASLKKYYSEFLFKDIDISVETTICEFPDTFTTEEILEVNPIKANIQFVYNTNKTVFYSLKNDKFEIGNMSVNNSIDVKKIIKFYEALSAYKMQEASWVEVVTIQNSEGVEPLDTMFSNFCEYKVDMDNESKPKSKAPLENNAIYFVKLKSEYAYLENEEKIIFTGDLTKYIESPFCPEIEITKKIQNSSFSMYNNILFENSISSVSKVKNIFNMLFNETPKDISYTHNSVGNAEPAVNSKEAIMKKMADSMKSVMTNNISLPSGKNEYIFNEEGIEFFWYYATLNPHESIFKNFFEFQSTELYSKTPLWWNDTATKVYMTKYFQMNKDTWIKPGLKYKINNLDDSLYSLLRKFFGSPENVSNTTTYTPLYETLFNTKTMSRDTKEAWVRLFADEKFMESKGETVGSNVVYKAFMDWIRTLPVWESVKRDMETVFSPISEFTSLMKSIGYDMTRRKQGNVYLNIAPKYRGAIEVENKEKKDEVGFQEGVSLGGKGLMMDSYMSI